MSQGEPTTVNPSGASPARRAPLPCRTPESQGIPSAAILAMLRHYREDRDFMYGLDIKFLDEARGRKG